MIIDLIKDINYRGFAFEDLSERYLRKKTNNYFIFRASRFASFEKLVSFYNLKLKDMEKTEFLSKYYKTIDIIRFNLDHYTTKNVQSIEVYEVKTKKHTRNKPVDISRTAHNRYLHLLQLGFSVKIVMILMYDNWKLSIDEHDYSSFNKSIRNPKLRFFNRGRAGKYIILNPIKLLFKKKVAGSGLEPPT